MVLRYFLTTVTLFGLLTCFSETTFAQKKKPPQKRTTSAAPASSKSVDTVLPEKRAAAQQLAVQLKGLTQFIYVFGGVTKSFESVEEASEGKDVPNSVVRKTEQTRSVLVDSVRTVRGNLERLENDFSGRSTLRPYFHFLVGVSDLAGQAELQIKDGQLKEAGQSLIKVASQLTETLAGMQD